MIFLGVIVVTCIFCASLYLLCVIRFQAHKRKMISDIEVSIEKMEQSIEMLLEKFDRSQDIDEITESISLRIELENNVAATYRHRANVLSW